jgi:hypothetical protein
MDFGNNRGGPAEARPENAEEISKEFYAALRMYFAAECT